MEVILLGIYGFFVWLIFYKFKWLPMNFTAACHCHHAAHRGNDGSFPPSEHLPRPQLTTCAR